jgi:hypothetical protein
MRTTWILTGIEQRRWRHEAKVPSLSMLFSLRGGQECPHYVTGEPHFSLFTSGRRAHTLLMKLPHWLFALLFAMSVHAAQIVVDAGEYDRRETVVRVALPAGDWLKPVALKSGENETTPLQVHGRDAWFIVRDLKRGTRRTYTAVPAESGQFIAQAEEKPDSVTLRVRNKTALVYRTTKTTLPPNRPDLKPIFQRGAYIHPMLSPSGLQVTDDYPSNHRHHHGIWFAWTKTEFEGRAPDFWNMGDGKGTVEFVALNQTWNGPVHAGFISKHRQVDLSAPEPKTALDEAWSVRLYAVGQGTPNPLFLFDIDVTNSCASGVPLKLPQYRYGGIGVRGNWAWNGRTKLNFLASNGSTDRMKGDKAETRGHWAHMGGTVDGQLTGIAILGHPANIHSPQPMRIHPDEPFFNFAPQQAGAVEITPDKPLPLRYRFVVADGPPDKALLESLWNDYAHPPQATVMAD